MRQIALAQDERDKVIEMCKRVFSEYTTVRWGRSYETDFIWMDSIPNPNPDPFEIHWFELCMTYLPERMHAILKKACTTIDIVNEPEKTELYESVEPELLSVDILDIMCRKGIHPISTLYDEFKKIIIFDHYNKPPW